MKWKKHNEQMYKLKTENSCMHWFELLVLLFIFSKYGIYVQSQYKNSCSVKVSGVYFNEQTRSKHLSRISPCHILLHIVWGRWEDFSFFAFLLYLTHNPKTNSHETRWERFEQSTLTYFVIYFMTSRNKLGFLRENNLLALEIDYFVMDCMWVNLKLSIEMD